YCVVLSNSHAVPVLCLLLPPPPCSTLFPYTTLFRSRSSQASTCSMRGPATPGSNANTPTSCESPRRADTTRKLAPGASGTKGLRSEEHTSELQSREKLVCRLLLEKKKTHTYQRKMYK